MKNVLILFLILPSLLTFGQEVLLPAETQPFYQILEWKGGGLLALSRDPSFQQRQVLISMIDNSGKVKFQQQLNPLQEKFHFLTEEGSKYCYFIEDLEPKEGRVYLHQLNLSGNMKVEKVDLIGAIKKLGKYESADIKVMDLVCVDKALIWLIRIENKETKTNQTIAVSMTHHNFLTYAFMVSEHPFGSSKAEDQMSWYLAGEKGENFIFAARTHSGKNAGWQIKEFGVKGQLVNSQAIGNLNLTFAEHSRVGFGRRGMAILKRIEPKEKGTLVIQNGEIYVGGIEVSGATAKVVSYKWSNTSWELTQQTTLKTFNPKKDLDFGFMLIKQGMLWYVKNSGVEGHFHGIDKVSNAVTNEIEQASFNPSRMTTTEYPGKIITLLNDQWILFDPSQLLGKKQLTFQLKKI